MAANRIKERKQNSSFKKYQNTQAVKKNTFFNGTVQNKTAKFGDSISVSQ